MHTDGFLFHAFLLKLRWALSALALSRLTCPLEPPATQPRILAVITKYSVSPLRRTLIEPLETSFSPMNCFPRSATVFTSHSFPPSEVREPPVSVPLPPPLELMPDSAGESAVHPPSRVTS